MKKGMSGIRYEKIGFFFTLTVSKKIESKIGIHPSRWKNTFSPPRNLDQLLLLILSMRSSKAIEYRSAETWFQMHFRTSGFRMLIRAGFRNVLSKIEAYSFGEIECGNEMKKEKTFSTRRRRISCARERFKDTRMKLRVIIFRLRVL